MEVGLGPGHIMLDGDLAPPPKKRAQLPPLFGPCLVWPYGWMDQDATWYRGMSRPWPHCVRWEPSSPNGKEQRKVKRIRAQQLLRWAAVWPR